MSNSRRTKIKPGTNSYETCERFVLQELEFIKKNRELKIFCLTHGLNYNVISMFSNKKLKRNAPHIISEILKALGYTVTLKKEITFIVE